MAIQIANSQGVTLDVRGLSRSAAHSACSGFRRGTIGSLPYSISRLIWTKIVGPVEDLLKIERHIRVAGQERDGDLGEPLRKGDRIDEELVGSIEAMDRDQVIERAGLGGDEIPGNGQRVRTAAQEVDLDQVSLAAKSLSLLLQKLLRDGIADLLVGWTQDFDRGDDLDLLVARRRISRKDSLNGPCSIVSTVTTRGPVLRGSATARPPPRLRFRGSRADWTTSTSGST